MTLEEGIIHAEDVARMNHEAAEHLTAEHPTQAEKCEECAKEHEQLAEWLKELKAYKEQSGDCISRAELKARMFDMPKRKKGAYWDGVDDVGDIIDSLPSVTSQPCNDCISRAEAQESISASISLKENPYQMWQRIQALPSVTPQQRTGRWIIIDDCEQFIAKCSECGRIEDSRMISKYPYCHCGAKMEAKE